MMREIVGETGKVRLVTCERDRRPAAPAPYSKRIGQRPCPVFRLSSVFVVCSCRRVDLVGVEEEELDEVCMKKGTYQSHGHL
jgi:hypothetical protein